MTHQIRVTLNNGKTVVIAVKNNALLVEAIIQGIRDVLIKVRKTITKMVDTYCWTTASYVVNGVEEAVITVR